MLGEGRPVIVANAAVLPHEPNVAIARTVHPPEAVVAAGIQVGPGIAVEVQGQCVSAPVTKWTACGEHAFLFCPPNG
jgi:hypothetical protein